MERYASTSINEDEFRINIIFPQDTKNPKIKHKIVPILILNSCSLFSSLLCERFKMTVSPNQLYFFIKISDLIKNSLSIS